MPGDGGQSNRMVLENFKRLLVGDLSVKRAVRSVILIALFVYVGLFAYARMFGNRIIFQPPPPSYQNTNEVIKLSSGGVPISSIHLKNPTATYTILYSHGNAEDIGTLRPTLEEIRKMGFSVFAYDCRGYGTSAGASSEKTTYEDIDAAYEYLIRNQKVPANRIIALGRSLGGAIAVDLASRKPLGGLIVENSFVSAYSRIADPVKKSWPKHARPFDTLRLYMSCPGLNRVMS